MRLTFSANPLDRFSCWFENSVVEPLSRYYYSKKKAHYQCTVCGYIEAPYFTGEKYASMTKDFGWHKFNEGKWSRWVCHHCADHGFSPSSENGKPIDWEHPREYTWDEWQTFVDENNHKILAAIKEKDPEYYDYWFNGGRERELFGEDDEDDND